MKEIDFSLYNNFATAVLVLDSMNRIVFKNIVFIKNFGNIKNLEKFSNYFNFDICMLDSENIINANPISFALVSPENFSAHAVYQKTKEQFLYFKLLSFIDRGYRVIGFSDLTYYTLFENLEKNYEILNMKYQQLEETNKNFSSSQQKAQNQAIKMALMHRISNVIRESMDLSKIVNSTLKELSNLFGATKIYYASFDENSIKGFKIENVYPSTFSDIIGENVEFGEKTLKTILAKNISIAPCAKEYLNSKSTYPASITRILVPVYRLNRFFGVLMIYTNQSAQTQTDILQSISTQLASAMVQAALFSEINKKNEELQKTLTELKETQVQLINSEKMASLGQLVAGVAHEINTPLASINSNNDILSKLISRFENCDEKLLNTFDSINKIDKEAIKRINQIVQSLKKFVRLDESELQEADINKELDLTLELIKHETKNSIKINKEYSDLPKIGCYPNMLNQVFMNILINACQSIKSKDNSKDKNYDVCKYPCEGEITIKTEFKDNILTVSIKDTGAGIDERIKHKIFTAGTTTKKIGTGLGLAISQKIIEKHKGSISFVTKKGEGTEFFINIPNSPM